MRQEIAKTLCLDCDSISLTKDGNFVAVGDSEMEKVLMDYFVGVSSWDICLNSVRAVRIQSGTPPPEHNCLVKFNVLEYKANLCACTTENM